VEVADEGKKATLVERIGGEQAVKIAVDMFDDRLRKNSATSKWLEGDNAALFVELQADFMRFALTGIPPNVDVGKFMATKHVALFRKGLSCDDFDNFAEVLQGVLKDLKVNDDVVEEVLVNVLPLRAVFAVEVQKVANAKQAQALNLVGGLFIVAAYVLLREGGK
jgi:truncated hemoglobin YjbI